MFKIIHYLISLYTRLATVKRRIEQFAIWLKSLIMQTHVLPTQRDFALLFFLKTLSFKMPFCKLDVRPEFARLCFSRGLFMYTLRSFKARWPICISLHKLQFILSWRHTST